MHSLLYACDAATSPSFSMVRRPVRAFSFPGLWSGLSRSFTMRSFLRSTQRAEASKDEHNENVLSTTLRVNYVTLPPFFCY